MSTTLTQEWTLIGHVEALQVQTGEMTGAGSYDTTMLLAAEELRLTPEGVFGLVDGAWILDRHHQSHPAARYWHAEDVLSFGFTSHYEHIGSLFGECPMGIAGENVIATAEAIIEPAGLSGIRVSNDEHSTTFASPQPMTPCVEFTRYITGKPEASARDVKDDREKLENGIRGYAVAVGAVAKIRLGDLVYIPSAP